MVTSRAIAALAVGDDANGAGRLKPQDVLRAKKADFIACCQRR